MSNAEKKRREALKRKMRDASRIYKTMKKKYPSLSQWAGEDAFYSWREVWQAIVALVMKGAYRLGLLRGRIVFSE